MSQQAPAVTSLKALRQAEDACTRCPLYRDATQAVPGEGRAHAPLMLVGEQPGDQEDKAGHPFVGPAGRVLDRAIAEAGIDRKAAFVTNAVKHFKFEPRGKRRLHKRPNAYEIDRCRFWLDTELRLVRPKVVVALGASAVRSLARRPMAIAKTRGKLMPLEDGKAAQWLVTIHPSWLLRIRDDSDKEKQYRAFVADLRRAKAGLAGKI
jgi:DNA polymerase